MKRDVSSRIVLAGVARRFGPRVAVEDVSLEVAPGTRLALIGPSGSGKTTLLRLIMGALRTSSGHVRIDGCSIAEMEPAQLRQHRRRCGLIDQGSLVMPQLSVHANVIAGRLAAWPWYKVLASAGWPLERAHVRSLLGEVGLADRQWDRAGQLSGGEQQRVSIARALAGEPSILLADEPAAALDPTTAREIIALLLREAGRVGATLVVSTHRVSQVLDHVDRVIGLRAGTVFFDRSPEDISDHDLDALYAGSRERA